VKKESLICAGVLLMATALTMPAAGQYQQQPPPPQPQQQQPPPTTFGVATNQPSPEEVEAYTKIATSKSADERLVLVQDFLTKYPESQLKGRVFASAAEAYRMQNKHAQVVEYGEKAIEDSQGRDAEENVLPASRVLGCHCDCGDCVGRVRRPWSGQTGRRYATIGA